MGLEPTTPGTTIRCSYQLSYTHHCMETAMARQEGLEPPAYCLEGSCSILLSYWRIYSHTICQGDGVPVNAARPQFNAPFAREHRHCAAKSLFILPSPGGFVKRIIGVSVLIFLRQAPGDRPRLLRRDAAALTLSEAAEEAREHGGRDPGQDHLGHELGVGEAVEREKPV